MFCTKIGAREQGKCEHESSERNESLPAVCSVLDRKFPQMDWKAFQSVCSFGIYPVCHEHLLLTVTMTGTHLWKQAPENVFVQSLREFDISCEHSGPNPRCEDGVSLCFKFSHPLTNVNISLYLGDKGIDFFFFFLSPSIIHCRAMTFKVLHNGWPVNTVTQRDISLSRGHICEAKRWVYFQTHPKILP